MDKVLPAIVLVAVVAVVFILLVRGWRTRQRSQAGLGAPAAPPAELGDVAYTEDLLYVATTRAEQPLERISISGLGFRARTVVTVAPAGILLDLAGADPVFIPRDALHGAGRGTWTIDKAVGAARLVVVTWRLGATLVDTYLRSADPARLLDAIGAPAPTPIRSDS